MKPESNSEPPMPVKFPRSLLVNLVYWVILLCVKILPSEDSVFFLMLLDNKLYTLHGTAANRYGSGIHIKHRLIKYHDFFIKRVGMNEKVLDIGCGNGCLTYDVAIKVPGVTIVGIDINEKNIEYATKHYSNGNIYYHHGDALKIKNRQTFDVIILSNVLEHIEQRIEFLKKVVELLEPKKLLIRVPIFERDWRVPLKKELGIDYRLDKSHFTEYTLESFTDEMISANLNIVHLESRWGEIWAEVIPDAA